jgi:hypothetical protein
MGVFPLNHLKKAVGLILAFVLLISLIGCSSNESTKAGLEKEVANMEEAPPEKEHNDANEISSTNKTDETVGEVNSSSINQEDEADVSNSDETDVIPKEINNTTTVRVKIDKKENQTAKAETKNSSNLDANQNKSSETTKKVESTTKSTVEASKTPEQRETVSIMIAGSSEIGVILKETKVDVKDGDTVFDVLMKAAKKKNIFVEYSGKGAMTYIEGIDNLYEFDYGPKSGWNFKLNGEMISKSSGIVKVKKDDIIEWIYSEDFTENQE